MRPPHVRHGFALLAVISAVLLGPLTASAGRIYTPGTEAGSGVDVKLEGWLESLPASGFVPLTLRIRNGDSQPHTWTFTSNSGYGQGGSITSSTSMTVEAGQTSERVVYAPVSAQMNSGYYYGSLHFSVQGHGINSTSAGSLDHGGGYGGNRTGFIAMGKGVSIKHWGALKDRLSSSSKSSTQFDLHGSEVDMANAPEDWRGYAGLAQLWMQESEWIGLRPAAKAAMMDWVAMGGRAFVLGTDSSDTRASELGLPAKVNGRRIHGAGQIELFPWSNTLPLEELARVVTTTQTNNMNQLLSGYRNKWGLRQLVGALTLNSGLIFGFIAIFGILIGPVNLFWLAPQGRRQRMFWTTPLISLAGSLVLMVIMVLQDGIGGTGARMTLTILQPEQRRHVTMQEQVSRTGVMLSSSFPRTDEAWMQPLQLSADTGFNPFEESHHTFAETDTMRTGDWFSSRSVQAQLLQTVRPSRAVVEFLPSKDGATPPSILSSMEVALKKVFIVDENRVWSADDVGTGEKKVMNPSTRVELDAWLRTGPSKFAGPVVRNTLDALMRSPGWVCAETADASKLAIPTLASIRWTDDRAFIAGSYLKH